MNLLISLPYLISSLHGHELFKIQLAFHHRELTSYLQQFDVVINKSKKRKGIRSLFDDNREKGARISQSCENGRKIRGS